VLLASPTDDSQSAAVTTREARPEDAPLVHTVYRSSPAYFEAISIPVPTLAEVTTDLITAAGDPRRHVELVLVDAQAAADVEPKVEDPDTGRLVVGYLDYKLDYPEAGDATVNLLLVLPGAQSRGIGGACARDLERRLVGRSRRMLASIFGDNPRARRFWERLGFSFAIDAKPHLDWYAKTLA
jgi:ribosomal protein S18 acetylase RimI-like enzyme